MSERRTLRRVVYGITLAIVVAFISAVLTLHSQDFRKYALTKIIQAAEQGTGVKIDVKKMTLAWYPLAIEFHGITAQSPSRIAKEPLFSADRVAVSLKILPLLRRQVEIDRVDLDRPTAYVRTESDGRTDLPAANQNQQATSNFQTQVALLIIRDGLIQYDNRQIPLSAELRGFRGQAALDRTTNSYRGEILYDLGRIETKGISSFDHRAELHFVADATHCLVELLDLSTLHSHLSVRGDVTDYTNPVFTGSYLAAVFGEDLRWITNNPSVPTGEVFFKGAVIYRTEIGPTFLDRTRLDGRFESGALRVQASSSSVALTALRGAYRLEGGQLFLEGVQGNTLGGHVSSDSDVIDLKANAGQVRLAIRGASLEQASYEINPRAKGAIHPAGLTDLDVNATWKGSLDNLNAHGHGVIRNSNGSVSSKEAIPVEGVIDADYDAARERVSFGQSTIRTGSTQLTVSGSLSRDSTLNVHLTAHDLQELSALISTVMPPNSSNTIAAYDLRGATEFTGRFTGVPSNPHIEGQLAGTDIQVEGTKWRMVHARIAIDSKSLALDDGTLIGSQKGRIGFNGNAKLANWSFDPVAPLSLHTRIENVSATDLQKLGKISYPVQGLFDGELFLSGSQQHPVGRGHVELVQGVVWNEPLHDLAADFDGDRQTVRLNAQVHALAGALTARATYNSETRHYQVEARTQSLKLEQLHVLQQTQVPIAGQLTAELSGDGTFADPHWTGHALIQSLTVRGENFTALDTQFTVQHKHAELTLHSTVEDSTVQAKGSVELTDAYPVKITLDTGKVPIGPLLDKFLSGRLQGVAGQLELHVNLSGPLKEPTKIEGHAEIPTLQLQAKSIELSSMRPVTLDYHAGVLQIANAELKGSGTDVRINGSMPVEGPGDMNVTAKGTVDLGLLQRWTNGGHSSGQANVELHAQGKKTQPAVHGSVKIVNAVYTSDALPVGIEALNGEVSIDGNQLQFSNLSATAGGGTVTLGGSATYGQNTSFNLALDAKSVRVRQGGARAVLDANLALAGSANDSTLAGRVTIDKLSFNQAADLADIGAQFASDNTMSDSSSLAQHIKLKVAVQSADNLNLASSQLSLAGAANLNAVGTVANPVILGRVALISGEVFFLGKRFEIQSGTISFANTVRTEPVVSLFVNTIVDQYNITVNLIGPLDRLKTSYTSDPALSTADIINLLAFGQTTAQAASNAATPASVGAESAVANAVGGQVASQVQKLTGVSQLTINPLAGNNQNPGSQVAIQQRVSGNILLTFSSDITSAQNQSIQVQYQVKRNVTVSVLRDENGGYGLDVRYHKVF